MDVLGSVMKKQFLLSGLLALFLSGCDFFEDVAMDPAHEESYSEQSTNIVFEDENASKRAVVTASCQYNDNVEFRYFASPEEAHSKYWQETKELVSKPGSGKALKPFWDLRYVNSGELLVKDERRLEIANHALYTGLDAREGDKNIEAGVETADRYSDASVVQAKCVDGVLAAGTSLNLLDSDQQNIEYGGPNSTFIYRMAEDKIVAPWSKDKSGNLLIQGYFAKPYYSKYGDNMGGGVNIGLFLQNRKSGLEINYVIGLYTAGKAWTKEQPELKFDPTTHIVHVSTVVANGTKWVTKSPKSKSIEKVKSQSSIAREDLNKWSDFYRVNITYENLLNVLKELKTNPPQEVDGEDFGLDPSEWKLNSIYVQFELEEEGGDAILASSFKGFEVYTTKLPR